MDLVQPCTARETGTNYGVQDKQRVDTHISEMHEKSKQNSRSDESAGQGEKETERRSDKTFVQAIWRRDNRSHKGALERRTRTDNDQRRREMMNRGEER